MQEYCLWLNKRVLLMGVLMGALHVVGGGAGGMGGITAPPCYDCHMQDTLQYDEPMYHNQVG
jgi:hypothetical protein